MSAQHPNLQIVIAEGMIDLSWGHPDPRLLPVNEIRAAYDAAITRHGAHMLQYGWMTGPATLIEWLRARIAMTEARAPKFEELVITAGNSWAIDQLVTHCAKPSDAILVEAPTYHYGTKILRDRGNPLIAVKTDDEGIIIDALARQLHELKAQGVQPALLYCVPTFNNPTSRSLSTARRIQLIELAAREAITLIEDDAYRELAFDGAAPPSLWSMDTHNTVIRIGSFSKSIAPGLRLGYITCTPELAHRFAYGGVLDSGGGISHTNALMLAEFVRNEAFEHNVQKLRAAYSARCSALVSAMREFAPRCKIDPPTGGFFVWAKLPKGTNAHTLLARAEANGMSFVPGGKFFIEGDGSQFVRLSFSLYSPQDLREGAQRLAQVLN